MSCLQITCVFGLCANYSGNPHIFPHNPQSFFRLTPKYSQAARFPTTSLLQVLWFARTDQDLLLMSVSSFILTHVWVTVVLELNVRIPPGVSSSSGPHEGETTIHTLEQYQVEPNLGPAPKGCASVMLLQTTSLGLNQLPTHCHTSSSSVFHLPLKL